MPLFAHNRAVVGAAFETLDTSGLNTDQLAASKAAYQDLSLLVRLYPGLELAAVADDAAGTPEAKAQTFARRTGYVQSVIASQTEQNFLALDLAATSTQLGTLRLDQLGASTDDQRRVLDTLRAYQRTFAVTREIGAMTKLLGAGYASALAIAREHRERFQSLSGMPGDLAYKIWDRARMSLADASGAAASLVDTVHGLFGELAVGNLSPTVETGFRKLEGIEDLFGSLTFCACEDCQSILGPAAYFVDLMAFIDENLRTVFAGHPDHPLDLKTRRPDLWTLPLTCDNTNTRIPTLELVAEILESFIAHRLGMTDVSDRVAVTLVYKTTLQQAVSSFEQPFHLPLVRVDTYLAALQRRRVDILEILGAPADARTRAELELSPPAYKIIVTPESDPTRLAVYYGLMFSGGPVFDQIDATALVRAMHVDRAELGMLAGSRFVASGGSTVTIVPAKRTPDSVQNDVEWVRGLTADALDRMHRMTRVARAAGWTPAELDLIVTAAGTAKLDAAGLAAVAAIHALQRRLAVTVADACALAGNMPDALLAKIYNTAAFVAADGAWPQPSRHFVLPAFRQTPPATIDPAASRLATALRLDQGNLTKLVRALAPRLATETTPGFDPEAATEAARYFVLSADNLTLLYRHALVAKLLGTTLDELFALLRAAGLGSLQTAADVAALLVTDAWWRASRLSLDQVAFVLGQPVTDPTRFPAPDAIAAHVIEFAASALGFADTVFAVALGTTEQASRDVIAANASLFEAAGPGRFRLVAGLDLDAATIAPTAAVTAAQIRDVLRPFLASEVVSRAIGSALAMPTAKLAALAALAGQSFSSAAVLDAVRGVGSTTPLIEVIRAIQPLAVAFAAPAWTGPAIDRVRAKVAMFGAVPLPHPADAQHPAPWLALEQLQGLTAYARLAAVPDTNPDDLWTALEAFDPAAPGFPSSVDVPLARALGTSPGTLVGMRGRIAVSSVAITALHQLSRAVQAAGEIRLDGETFGGLASDDYDTLLRAADALVAGYGAAFTDDTTRATKLDEAEQPIREAKRDALAAYLIHSTTPAMWTSLDELYEYFLIDVEAGGCSTTSRVVAATTSAQLYVYRAIMNLEQDELPATDPAHVALRMPPDAAAEWEWRRNYRVWQANRKVFLWPENYLDPDLRDDKTSLFEDLEQELLQTDIDDQNVLDAYTKYLAGFEELASLTIAGAYHHVLDPAQVRGSSGVQDVLHLFGVSASDPPTYYYRTCENLRASGRDPGVSAVWSAWRKITVQITGRRVSPIVHRGRLHVFWTDIRTRSVSEVTGGASQFAGYRHQMKLRFTTLRPDGAWTAPQDVALPSGDGYFGAGRGQIDDPLIAGVGTASLDPLKRATTDAIDDYTVAGPNWDFVWPESLPDKLQLQYRDFLEHNDIDLFGRTATAHSWSYAATPYPQLLCARKAPTNMPLWCGTPVWMFWPRPGYANAIIDEDRMDVLQLEALDKVFLQYNLYKEQIATLPLGTQLLAIPGSEQDGIVQVGGDVLLVQGSVRDDGGYILRRLGTTLVETIARRLFEDGLDQVLDTQTQLALAEAGLPLTLVGSKIENRSNTGRLDFDGPYGMYYREIYFHTPFLIANALNSRGRYAAAQRWYRYLFDPTASEQIDITGLTPDEAAHRLLDRVWRYREFRGQDAVRLRAVLTDTAALALYKKDPFNPWAIARRRISAFQKTIVMKYVDNLLDWADSLFTQFTMESVNESLMLYITASDILGERPAELGDCGLTSAPRTYAEIEPALGGADQVLIELETALYGGRVGGTPRPPKHVFLPPVSAIVNAVAAAPRMARVRIDVDPVLVADASVTGGAQPAAIGSADAHAFRGFGWNATRTTSWAPALATATTKTGDAAGGRSFGHAWKGDEASWVGRFAYCVIRQLTPVFCVPPNTELLAYWDRVADRLFKIRHCMDIDGNKRELALFAPPIDPMQLVAMKAAGIGLDDLMASTNGSLPPYRFLYLIDRAKAYAASLSGFGSALLAALEKKEGEQLNRLRITQQMNLLQLTTQVRRQEIDTATEALATVQSQRDAAQYRSDYFAALRSDGLSDWEYAEAAGRHLAAGLKVMEGTLGLLAAGFGFLPQVGSPFAMKYGGVELHAGTKSFADASGSAGAVADGIAISAGLQGNFARRRDGWQNQQELASFDIKGLDHQLKAAAIRLDIANRSLALHEKGIDQLQEQLDLADGRFTNLGLYTWLSAQLQRSYRGAYQNALALAKLAERAYRFERGDDDAPGLTMTYWDSSHGGLLAGEQLLADLQTLERRFLETNYRAIEVDQAFALSQIDPRALIALRETGECTFAIDGGVLRPLLSGPVQAADQVGAPARSPASRGRTSMSARPSR